MASSVEWKAVAKLALYARCFIVLLQCLANTIIPDHDADVFNPPLTDVSKFTTVDRIIFFIFGGFRRWDAVYFLYIAQHGYTYENCVAFFPLYPLLTVGVKCVLSLICPFATDSSLLLLSGVVLNVGLFVAATVLLLYLGRAVTNDGHLAYYAAILFCINPASIFMAAPYTETLFACLSFGSMLCIRLNKEFFGAILIGASALTRSNGLVSVGFFLHYYASDYIARVRFAHVMHRTRLQLLGKITIETVMKVFQVSISLVFSVLPFACFQSYIYDLFCFPESNVESLASLEFVLITYGLKREYKFVGSSPVSDWCLSPLPLSYSYIQSHHWGVGFFRYFELRQIPNFILATPIIVLSFSACYSYYCRQPAACRMLGLMKAEKVEVETIGSQTVVEGQRNGFDNPSLVVYILHLLFLTVFGCCFMHIQVLTRFLCSASPVIYWYAAHLVCGQQISGVDYDHDAVVQSSALTFLRLKNHTTAAAKLIVVFFVGYTVIGTVLFSNFLPWT